MTTSMMMDMSMSSSTAMPMSTGTAMGDMGSMGSDMGSMGSMDGGMMTMDAMQMNMVFFTSTTTKLYSAAWSPNTTGQYFGTCLFLIVLAALLRCLIASKTLLERRWASQARQRRYIVNAVSRGNSDASALLRRRNVPGTTHAAEIVGEAKGGAVLTTNGLDENVRVVERSAVSTRQPWRLSVDLPRACLVTVIVGVGYLLMLAVMTMNVGYFCSILGGTFGADLFVGRFVAHGAVEDHDH